MKAFKTLFIWLLMSFIPLQGVAANALLVCKAANQGLQPSHAMQAVEVHGHPCVEVEYAAAPQEDVAGTDRQSDVNCVAQYAGVPWLPASGTTFPPLGFTSDRIAFAGFYMPSFIPEGPERPPRSLSL